MYENELPDKISFLTFNAGLLEYRVCGVKLYQNPPYTSHRLLQIPSALRGINADIIALQEVFDEKHSDYIVESLQPIYPYFARESRRPNRTKSPLKIWQPISFIHNQLALHNGLLVLSKYPILSARFTCFSDVTLIEEWFVSKGMLEVTIELPGMKNSPITLFNIHMASGAVNPESETIETLRNKEIEQLLGACDNAIRRGEIPVIIGDLNAAPNCCGSNYNYFIDRGWRDCFEIFRNENKDSTSASSNISSQINMRHGQNDLDYKGKHKYFDMDDLYDDLSSYSKENFTHSEDQVEEEHLTPSSNDSFSTKIDIDTTPMINMNIGAPNINKGNDDVAVVNKLVSSFAAAKAAVEAAKRGFSSCSPEPTNIEVVSTTKSSNCSNNVNEFQDDYPIKQYFVGNKECNSDKLLSPDYTWDPNNPLNVIGPHSNCHGQRCDHIFLPPAHLSKNLAQYEPHKSSIILREPRVMVDGWCFGCVGSTVLVTLSDHYGVYVELKRSLDSHCRNSQY
ncbi:sphingomyelinase C precursor [Cryptosporidium canis]|uniref:Sphingomyelinase C n=1 Tax=Cryptosporidium canis TaxID=195482 RepID=A0A9D5HVW4_9CRYT|nr:sphingomyelinase C precursor [Cryptosporidium canis]